ncbi:hypothetical protein GQ55_1G413100 [Panicum hallii var. hallii]|uniref:Uncharacterized protein n=1 Tax=Panicum hallii var. hallii TaxID=1504633 RepID=A0A2T7FCX0_9POAL|nr:hypothetical protein GQ55_1G413100 [Panicum hallii var. hallii]
MPRGRGSGGEEVADLWAMAAELERQFAGYRQRLAERGGTAARERDDDAAAAAYDGTGGVGGGGVYEAAEADEAGGRGSSSDVRGRMYEAYVRRRDERLREGWRARMERKEAEVKALWAQLELTGRAGAGAERAPGGGGDPTTDGGAATGDERKTERNDDDDKRRSSDTAVAPRRITGKKHARTRSFSSSITANSNRSDAGRRRALSQEPPPSEPDASAEGRKDNRVRPAGGAATTTATARPKTFLRRKNSVKGHVSATTAGPKLPRSLPRRASSGGLEALSREAALPIAEAAAPVQSSSSEYPAHGETPKAAPPRPFLVKDDSSDVTSAANARAASPESERVEGVETVPVPDGESEAENADVEKLCEEKVDASSDKLGSPNGEITSDSETEPSYVYINKDNAEEQAMTVPEPLKLACSDAALDSDMRTNKENGEEMPAPADATAAEIATTNAEEAPARESSDESLLSVRSGLSARPSCSSRDQSIERLLEADAVLLRKKREERAEKSTPKSPGSAGSRVSGAARSPRGAVRGFKKFLSFGKKNRGREATVIDCTSPSVPSLADDDSTSGGWQSVGSIKPRMGSSDAASDDTDHGYTVSLRVSATCSLQSLVAASPAKSELAEIVPQEKSPKAPRSFFSFRSLNCGRG